MGWADVPARNEYRLVTVHEHSNQLINYLVTVHLHSNQLINFLLAERALCMFCMQEDEQPKVIRGRITWDDEPG
jgi:hypothetical protein